MNPTLKPMLPNALKCFLFFTVRVKVLNLWLIFELYNTPKTFFFPTQDTTVNHVTQSELGTHYDVSSPFFFSPQAEAKCYVFYLL